MEVLFHEEVSEADAASYKASLEALPCTKSARLVTREEGVAELREMLGEDFLDVFESTSVPLSVELTLKELRCNVEKYDGIKVAFEGVITKNDGGSVYMEDYDPDTGLYYGISVFYGYNLPGKGLDILSVGNRSRIVGTVQYYEAGEVYQVAGLSYRQMKPKDPGNIQKISDGHTGSYRLTDVGTFLNGKVLVEDDEGKREYDYAYLALGTTIEMHNLKVRNIRTEDDPASSSYGAMTMDCEISGVGIRVRTDVLIDSSRNIITSDAYLNKVIDVRGVVDYHNGRYQIKVLSAGDITIIQ